MAISGDYANPVTVNGFACKNCTEVDLAKKNVDPAHPQDGPFGINDKARNHHGPALKFGGTLTESNLSDPRPVPQSLGTFVNISA